jgi:transcriptional regulator with XRE-family HTH domain
MKIETTPALRRRARPISQADLCRLTGLGSSTVSQACRGALACSRLSDGLYDAANDVLIQYLVKHQQPSEFALYPDVYAEICGCSIERVKTALQRGGELIPALTLELSIRVCHPASLAFISKFPFGDMDENHDRHIPPLLEMTSEREWMRIPSNPLHVVWKTRLDAWMAAP